MSEQRTFGSINEIVGKDDEVGVVLTPGHRDPLRDNQETDQQSNYETVKVEWTPPDRETITQELYFVNENAVQEIAARNPVELTSLLQMVVQQLANLDISMSKQFFDMYKNKGFTPVIVEKISGLLKDVQYAQRQVAGVEMITNYLPKEQINKMRINKNDKQLTIDEVINNLRADAHHLAEDMKTVLETAKSVSAS